MENYVANVIPHLQQWWPVLIVLAYLVGIGFVMMSVVQAVSHKNRFNRAPAVWSFLAAVLLLNLPTLMDSLSMTLFNASSEQTLSYTPPSSEGSVYIQFAVYAIMTIGMIGIARGVCLLRDTPNQSANFSRAITHMVGGIIAINLVTFLRGIAVTIGEDVQSYVAKILG